MPSKQKYVPITKFDEPKATDIVYRTQCRSCGVIGIVHEGPDDCIDALRDIIAELSEKPIYQAKKKRTKDTPLHATRK